jgi:anti-sigma28 factor (negative regulator of flagellin synthesis)
MPRIGDIGQPEQTGGIRRGEQRRAERASTDRARADGAARAGASSEDDVSEMRAHQARLVEGARNAPDVRADRVALARARIQEGFYDRPEVRAEIADRALQSFVPKD